MNLHEASLLWYDFETFGTSAQKDLPCQFAAIRTDSDLNIVGKPINIMSQIANDYLPHPRACLITGITPQQTLRDGMVEAEFARKINEVMSQPNTCVAGFNSIRFDDEVTRNLLFRNFIDPYAREWRNGNSRWDIIDLARACYALRPEGINWPKRDDGTPSFRLEHLTAANDLEHGHAHDALSDVYATIALAKLIKTRQPRLYNYAFSLRSKHQVLEQFNFAQPSALLHVSSRLPAKQGCCTWVLPVAMHPKNPNAVIVIDLARSPDPLIYRSVEEIRHLLYTRADELDENTARPGLKLIHINRSPFVTTAKAMSEENAARLGIDRDRCLSHYRTLLNHSHIFEKAIEVYDDANAEKQSVQPDVDHALYSGGFLNDEERRWCDKVCESSPETLASLGELTQNLQLRSMLFRYRARNYPQTLTFDEMQKWQEHRRARLTDSSSPASITLEPYMMELEALATEYKDDPQRQAILRALYQYAQNL